MAARYARRRSAVPAVRGRRSLNTVRAKTGTKRARTPARSRGPARKRARVVRPKRVKRGRAVSRRANPAAKTGASLFRFGAGPRVPRGFKREKLPTTFTSTTALRINGIAGTQAVDYLPTYQINAANQVDAPTQEQGTYNSAFTIDHRLLRRAELWLAHGTMSIASVAGPAFARSQQDGERSTMKYVCNFLRYDQMIRNMSLQDVDIILYDCVLRSSVVPSSPEGGANLDKLPNPITDWESGLLNERSPSTQSATFQPGMRYQSPGTTPFQSTLFTKLYKIVKVTKQTLSAGEVHHHHINLRPRNLFDGQQKDLMDSSMTISASSRGAVFPGLTGFTMIVALGSIVNNKTVKTTISTSAVALDVITKTTGSFASFTRERRRHLQFDGIAWGAAAGALQGVQDDDGEIVDDVAA